MNDSIAKFTFVALDTAHQGMVTEWLNADHVKPYFHGEGLDNTLRDMALFCEDDPAAESCIFDHWIALSDGVPFGYLMTSPVVGPHNPDDPVDKWYIDGKLTFTLDLLIGPVEFLGRGLAHVMIQKFILDKFSHADYFIIDPEQNNSKAVRVYEKAGFVKVDEFIPSYDPKPHFMMRLAVASLSSNVSD